MTRRLVLVALIAALAVPAVSAGETDAEAELAAEQARLDEASEGVNQRIAKLPLPIRNSIGVALKVSMAPIRLLTHGLSRNLATGFHESVTDNVEYAADLMESISAELDGISGKRLEEVDAATEQRLRQLQEMTDQTIEEVRAGVDEAIDRSRDSILRVEEEAEVAVLRVLDRSLLGAIRLLAITLFLVSLMTGGLRLLSIADRGRSWSEISGGRVLLASAGLFAVTVVVLASLALAIRPELLAIHSARVELSLRQDPCSAYEAHRARLARAEAIGSVKLVELTRARVDASRQDCVGAD